MSKKEKNKSQTHRLRSILSQEPLAILIVSLLCCGLYYVGLSVKDFFAIRDCSESTNFLEWDGIFNSVNAPQSEILITEENSAQVNLLGTFSASVPDYYTYAYGGRKHPQQAYSLHYTNPQPGSLSHLVLCQPESNFASQVFSGNIDAYSFSPDAQFFAFANGLHSEVRIYDANTLEFYGQIGLGTEANDRYTLTISVIAFHPTEPLIAFALFNHPTISSTVQFWNYESLSFVSHQDIAQEGMVTFMAFNAEGTELFIRVDDNDILAYGIPPE